MESLEKNDGNPTEPSLAGTPHDETSRDSMQRILAAAHKSYGNSLKIKESRVDPNIQAIHLSHNKGHAFLLAHKGDNNWAIRVHPGKIEHFTGDALAAQNKLLVAIRDSR